MLQGHVCTACWSGKATNWGQDSAFKPAKLQVVCCHCCSVYLYISSSSLVGEQVQKSPFHTTHGTEASMSRKQTSHLSSLVGELMQEGSEHEEVVRC